MKVIRSLDELGALNLAASAVAIGMFDGVHTGHKMVLESALRQARQQSDAQGGKIPAVVFTFANHPQNLLSNSTPPLLSTLAERLHAFEALGMDIAVVPDFSPALRDLTPERFVKDILLAQLGAQSVSIGYDHHFGKNRAGNGEVLQVLGDTLGFDVQVIAPVRLDDEENHDIVSSTLIRKLLGYGDVAAANALLGYRYILSGPVAEGFARGRQLGFPTANVNAPAERLMPATGVYAGYAHLHHETYPAVCNIGFAPTFDGGTPEKRMEVFLLDYNGPDFYNETLGFEFVDKIRDEQKFDSKDALIAQIKKDCTLAQGILRELENNEPSGEVHHKLR